MSFEVGDTVCVRHTVGTLGLAGMAGKTGNVVRVEPSFHVKGDFWVTIYLDDIDRAIEIRDKHLVLGDTLDERPAMDGCPPEGFSIQESMAE